MKKRLVISVLFGILFLGLTFIPTVSADDSCWESTETSPSGYELISKVENPVHCVYDDDPDPLDTYEDYPIWVYGRFYNIRIYSNIRVKIYIQAFYHVETFRYGVPIGSSEYWADAPYGMFKWNGDYQYGSETPGSVSWSASIGGGNDNFQMSLSASYTPGVINHYYEENNEYGSDVGAWRYMGWIESEYNVWPFGDAAQEFTSLLRLHIIHSVAEDYYEGKYWTNGRYSRITYVEAFRFKLVFKFFGGAWGPLQDTHTHIMGNDIPSDEDVDGIPLCIGVMAIPES
ncbi:MAG: hypothetical protein ACFFDD_12715 [Promethearchaeota archaeon]